MRSIHIHTVLVPLFFFCKQGMSFSNSFVLFSLDIQITSYCSQDLQFHPVPAFLDDALRSLLERCLSVSYQKRPTARECLRLLAESDVGKQYGHGSKTLPQPVRTFAKWVITKSNALYIIVYPMRRPF